MKKYRIEFVDRLHPDFVNLIKNLDQELHEMYGELQKSFDVHNTTEGLEVAVVVYEDDEPVACGGYKPYDASAVEIKRVFVKKEFRGNSLSTRLMQSLELEALSNKYSRIILETGTEQQAALELYKKRGYEVTENYPPYVGNIHSICMEKQLVRCFWAGEDLMYQAYHDFEWGRPVHDDIKLFEMLILEGAQAGLSWITILKRREGYRVVFDGFDWNINAAYADDELEERLKDSRIIRNRLKVFSVRSNAIAYQRVIEEFGSFDSYLWAYVDYEPLNNAWPNRTEIPVSTAISDRLSKDLKKRGFKFVGSTIIYAYMQAIGMVNDHMTQCVCYGVR